MASVLIAGVGNIFLGDDGFGVEVARRLAKRSWPRDIRIADFGIRGVHLAYELADRQYDLAILVDATPRGGEPGTVYLIEPTLEPQAEPDAHEPSVDAHGMQPEAVFSLLRRLGGRAGRVLIVGCEPAAVEEGIGLSEAVERAVDEAIELIARLMAQQAAPGCPDGA